jgi:glycerate-2-kinase
MSAAAIDCLRTSATCPPVSGLIVTKYGHCAGRETLDAAGINIIEAGHPVPDANGMAAAAAMMELVNTAAPGTLILLLLSGGGSALLPLPPAGMSLADLQGMNSALLACGASIDEVNMLRKHTSRIAGGRLAAAAARRPGVDLITLVLSDVVGDRLDVIASGPTVPDAPNSTWAACNALLAKYDLVDARDGLDGAKRAGPRLPVSVRIAPPSYELIQGCPTPP